MELQKIREHIDFLDDQITKLYIERMALLDKVVEAKKTSNKAVADPLREQQIIERVTAYGNDEINPYIERLFREIFSASKDYQKTKF